MSGEGGEYDSCGGLAGESRGGLRGAGRSGGGGDGGTWPPSGAGGSGHAGL